jgi:hypothetical protein
MSDQQKDVKPADEGYPAPPAPQPPTDPHEADRQSGSAEPKERDKPKPKKPAEQGS